MKVELSQKINCRSCNVADVNSASTTVTMDQAQTVTAHFTESSLPPPCATLDYSRFVETTLSEGMEYYTDRDYTLTNVPAAYVGLDTILTPNDDRNLTDSSDYLTFEMLYDGTVYVAFDSRATSPPDWMDGFVDTGDILTTSLSSQPSLKIYRQTYFENDCVNLGANKALGFSGSTVSNYIVFYGIGCNGGVCGDIPSADASGPYEVTDIDGSGSEDITLDGSASFDTDGTIVSYEWFECGTLIGTGANPTLPFSVGMHMVTLTVTDNEGDTSTDTATVAVLSGLNEYSYALKPYSENNYYWEITGEPVFLLGGSWQDNPWQWAGCYEKNVLLDQLDTMVSVGANYIRNTMSQRNVAYSDSPEYYDVGMAYPFVKSDGKYNLDIWNDEHWNRLSNFLHETSKRGIIVQLEIWDDGAIAGNYPWSISPWNGENNVNYDASTVSASTFFESIPEINNNTTVLYYQNKYIEKMLSITLNYENVIYQINNESSFDFRISDYWSDFIYDAAAMRGKTVYVCDSRHYHYPSYPSTDFQLPEHIDNEYPLQNHSRFTFLDISQNGGNTGQVQYDNLIWYRNQTEIYKIRPINHTKTYMMIWPTGFRYSDRTAGDNWTGTTKLWRTILGGGAGVRFHRNTMDQSGDFLFGLGLTEIAQTHIISARMLLNDIFIFSMQPMNSLLSSRENDEAYCLAEIGKQYAVYFTKEGDTSVEIELPNGTYDLKWLNIESSSLSSNSQISGGIQTLTAPSDEQSVAIITNTGIPFADASGPYEATDTDSSGSEDITLDGSTSFDTDGTIASYEWYEDNTLIGTGVSPTLTFSVGTHAITLTVTDNDANTNSDTTTVTVNP